MIYSKTLITTVFTALCLVVGSGHTQPPHLATDVYPVTTGSPPVTRASVPGKTFQVRPPVAECDPTIPQTPHPGGMLTALFDGSMRTVRGAVDESVFWSAVTRTGGETGGLDD